MPCTAQVASWLGATPAQLNMYHKYRKGADVEARRRMQDMLDGDSPTVRVSGAVLSQPAWIVLKVGMLPHARMDPGPQAAQSKKMRCAEMRWHTLVSGLPAGDEPRLGGLLHQVR